MFRFIFVRMGANLSVMMRLGNHRVPRYSYVPVCREYIARAACKVGGTTGLTKVGFFGSSFLYQNFFPSSRAPSIQVGSIISTRGDDSGAAAPILPNDPPKAAACCTPFDACFGGVPNGMRSENGFKSLNSREGSNKSVRGGSIVNTASSCASSRTRSAICQRGRGWCEPTISRMIGCTCRFGNKQSHTHKT